MTTKKKQLVKILTPEFRVSYPSLFEKRAPMQGSTSKPKYELTMLFKKNADLSEMKKAAMKEAVAMFGPKESWPEGFKWPFRDGDKKKDRDGYVGHIYVKATSTQPVGVLNRDKTPIAKDDPAFYAGCYARATVVVQAFNKNGGTGVCFYVNNVIKTKDGQEFTSRASAEDDFADLEIESDGSDDPENYEDEESDSESMW